ncbi:MAG TPA: response regulator [Vicinamibacterales bacterium]|nr:response regulator [Vicinamibacterales bacterium]
MLPVSRPVTNAVLQPALQAANIRDRVGTQSLQDLALLAAGICDAPVGFVTLTDSSRQAPAALHGLPRADTRYLICADAAMREASGALLVAYTASDPRVGGAHMLLNEPAIRSCAVVVLESAEGLRIGTLGIVDFRPKNISADQLRALNSLARHAATLFEYTLSSDERRAVAERRNVAANPEAKREFDQHNLAAVAEGLPELVALADLEGRLFHLNAAAVAMTGIPADGGGKRLSDLHPRDRHAFLEAGIAGALGDGFWQGDNLLLGTDGEPRLASQVIVVPRDANGRPACLATVIRDVSEQRAQQEQLRVSEHRLRQVIEHVADVLFEQDAEGRFTFLNPAWCDATGFTLDESLGRHFVEFVHPDDATATREAFEALLNEGTVPAIQPMRYLTRDGQFRWMEARARQLTDANDMPAGTIGTLRDVTAQRAMAEEIARAHQQALQSSAMMSEFLANMSHEIRTPLNGVVGLTSILAESTLTADQRQLVLGAQQSAETLLTLVNDILDISKIEAGSLLLEQSPFAIRDLINEMAEPGFGKARKKGLDVRLDVSAELPARIVGDATRFGQVLSNLIDNAVKFTETGLVSVVAVPSRSPDGRRMLRVSVTDSGIGIPLDKQAVVFEKYRQADSSSTRRYGGTGLGLAICRQLAMLMDGDIGLESTEGVGSTFWFAIPLAAAPVEEPHAGAAGAPAPGKEPPATPRALLVEDNPTNQFVARRFIEKAGCVVEVASNGAEALEKIAAADFDVVFMDCQMPIMDGYEATRRIRQGRLSSVPIVAMTAHAMKGDRERCLAVGMTEYLSKPLKPNTVAEMIERVLRLHAGSTT